MHVWLIALDQPDSTRSILLANLSDDEVARANRFHFRKDHDHFIVARAALRTIVGRYLGCEPSAVRFDYSSHGKPFLPAELGSDLEFNLSHSHKMALLAVNRGRWIGADIEHMRENIEVEEIAVHFFSKREVAVLLGLPKDLHRQAFFNCWTRKEAYIKAIGEGLSHPLDKFDVTLSPGEEAMLLCTRVDLNEARHWSLRALDVPEGYAAALAVRGHDWSLTCWDWQA